MLLGSSKRNSASALAQFGFADAGGPQEQERADGPVGVAQAGAAAADGVADGAMMASSWPTTRVRTSLFHLHQALALALEHARDGDAGPLADDLGDVLFGDLVVDHGRAVASWRAGFGLFEFGASSLQLARIGARGPLQVARDAGRLRTFGSGLASICSLSALTWSMAPFSVSQRAVISPFCS
jgi:hypothetical protein